MSYTAATPIVIVYLHMRNSTVRFTLKTAI